MAELERVQPDVLVINLETAITRSHEYWQDKGISYRMHPRSLPSLQVAGIQICAMAKNHVLDWGFTGFEETLQTRNPPSPLTLDMLITEKDNMSGPCPLCCRCPSTPSKLASCT